MWIHYERLHNHNKAKHNKTVCIFLGIYCTVLWELSDCRIYGIRSPVTLLILDKERPMYVCVIILFNYICTCIPCISIELNISELNQITPFVRQIGHTMDMPAISLITIVVNNIYKISLPTYWTIEFQERIHLRQSQLRIFHHNATDHCEFCQYNECKKYQFERYHTKSCLYSSATCIYGGMVKFPLKYHISKQLIHWCFDKKNPADAQILNIINSPSHCLAQCWPASAHCFTGYVVVIATELIPRTSGRLRFELFN